VKNAHIVVKKTSGGVHVLAYSLYAFAVCVYVDLPSSLMVKIILEKFFKWFLKTVKPWQK